MQALTITELTGHGVYWCDRADGKRLGLYPAFNGQWVWTDYDTNADSEPYPSVEAAINAALLDTINWKA